LNIEQGIFPPEWLSRAGNKERRIVENNGDFDFVENDEVESGFQFDIRY
jgi:hypothetical protein